MNTYVASLGATLQHRPGMVVRHGEAFSITEENSRSVRSGDRTIYRPTVH